MKPSLSYDDATQVMLTHCDHPSSKLLRSDRAANVIGSSLRITILQRWGVDGRGKPDASTLLDFHLFDVCRLR